MRLEVAEGLREVDAIVGWLAGFAPTVWTLSSVYGEHGEPLYADAAPAGTAARFRKDACAPCTGRPDGTRRCPTGSAGLRRGGTMSDIQISDLSIRDCDISVWNQDESCCVMLFRPPHTMTLEIADGKDRKPTPWFYSIEFTSRAEWFKFVRLVNAMNRKIKKTPADEHGFPIMAEWREK